MNYDLDILAFSPHPDDVELGCGGSLIVAAQQGLQVAVADLSAGTMSSRGTPQQRQQESKKAADLLGLCARFSLGLPDSELGTAKEQRLPIIELIRESKPRLVLAPYWKDRHPDHVAASKLVREACFFAGVRKIGQKPPHRPEQLFYYMIHSPFTPSFVIDVSAVWERRMAAVKAYKSQFDASEDEIQTAISGSDFLRVVEARAIWFGAMIGVAYGEPFLSSAPVPQTFFPGLSNPRTNTLPTYRTMG